MKHQFVYMRMAMGNMAQMPIERRKHDVEPKLLQLSS